MPRDVSGPIPFKWTAEKIIALLVTVIIVTTLATLSISNNTKYEDITSIEVKYNNNRDSCYILRTSTWEVTDSILIIRSEERGSTKFFPLNEVKSIDVTERKVRIK